MWGKTVSLGNNERCREKKVECLGKLGYLIAHPRLQGLFGLIGPLIDDFRLQSNQKQQINQFAGKEVIVAMKLRQERR